MKKFLFAIIATLCVSNAAFADKKEKEVDSYSFRRGVELEENGDHDAAIKMFQVDLKDNPRNGKAWAWIMSIRFKQEKYGESITAGEKALTMFNKKDTYWNGYVHSTFSRVYYAMGEEAKSLDEISLAIESDPSEDDYLSMRADLLYTLGRYDESTADYREIIKETPGSVEGYMGVGRNLIAQEQWQEAIDMFSYSIKLDENCSQNYAFRADGFIGTGQYPLAAKDLVKALEIDDNSRACVTIFEVNDAVVPEILALLRVKIAKDDSSERWHFYAGKVHQGHGQYRNAIDEFRKCLSLNDNELYHYYIAQCYGELGDYVKAHEHMDVCVEADSTDTDYIMAKSNYYYYQDKMPDAFKWIDRFVELEPEEPFGYYRRGFMKDNTRDIDGAIEDYTTCIALDNNYPYAYLGRGDMYNLKGDTLLARRDYQSAADRDSIIEKQGNCRMYALLALGMRDSAEVWMQKMLDKFPTEGNYYDAACLMSRAGELDKALLCLQNAFEKGYHEFEHMKRDDDLDKLRDLPAYKALYDKYYAKVMRENVAEQDTTLTGKAMVQSSCIPFKKEGDMMKIACTINDLALHFIFDTGCSDVSISDVEANFMLKNGYLSKNDIQGKQKYSTADGSIHEGTVINLKNVVFGDVDLKDIKASVVKNQSAPLLLGQSVFKRLGNLEIDNKNNMVRVTYVK